MTVDTYVQTELSSVSHENVKSKGSIPEMKNFMKYCPKCKYFVGCWDKIDYYQCCRNKKHKIAKEIENG